MGNFMLSLCANIGVVSLFAFPLQRQRWIQINWRYLILLLGALWLYILALTMPYQLPIESVFPNAQWNWGGKINAITFWIVGLLAMQRLLPEFNPAAAGFTFRQREGSLRPALIGILFVCLFQFALTQFAGTGSYTSETLLFQASMPGLDEEPMYRGLLLWIAARALVSPRFKLMGAPIEAGGLALTLLFGLAHGLGYTGQTWVFSLFSISITGFYGLILLWLRERTGSLLLPVLAHNLINVIGQFKIL